jgi:flavin reductase (DIM6/NTAB) family NADH-FMN oxidoreductase RutF
MAVSAAEFRTTLRHFPAGVTVVTARDRQGAPYGLTVSAFASVSLAPPLVLVCIDHAATAYPALLETGWFAVNMLGKSQEHLSRRFAASISDKFVGIGYRQGPCGLPLLDDVVASLECRVTERYPGGDHTIFIGQVESTTVTGGPPLLYFAGGYHHLESESP